MSRKGRPGLQAALEVVESGQLDALVVAKLDRLSRSLLEFAGIVERARTKGWNLVCLDIGIDLSTPGGEMLAGTLAVFAQFERRLIGQRTRSPCGPGDAPRPQTRSTTRTLDSFV